MILSYDIIIIMKIDVNWLKQEIKVKSLRLIAEESKIPYSAIRFAVIQNKLELPSQLTVRRRILCDKSAISKEAYKKKYPNGAYGELGSNWKGGTRIIGGYRYIYAPESFSCKSRGTKYGREHVIIIEEHLQRILNKDEIVHHKNGNKLNNRLENLEVLKRKEHVQKHFEAVQLLYKAEKKIHYLENILQQNNISYNYSNIIFA